MFIFPFGYYGYIEKLSGDGWLNVLTDSGGVITLPEYLRVYVAEQGKREKIEILEGSYRGMKATAKHKGWRFDDFMGSYFDLDFHTGKGCPHREPAELIFYQKSNKLKIIGVGEFNTYMDPKNPVPAGIYDLEIPDTPHEGGSWHTDQAPHAKTWFRIGHRGDRYLHCGENSDGCIAVKEIHKWETIYKHLIVSRKGFDNVGTIKVINS